MKSGPVRVGSTRAKMTFDELRRSATQRVAPHLSASLRVAAQLSAPLRSAPQRNDYVIEGEDR